MAQSSSPYLRQHAHNPVFWYPWGKEAIERARAEDKPILLSIGYSTCYWCHVMEREVFENLSIAALMNRCFINVKVDREEHPQLDDIYMLARQLLTHEGGWPNNVFLTPELKPFYAGGTYAADESYGKPAFPRLLEWLHTAWTNQRGDLLRAADQLTDAMRGHLVFKKSPGAAAEPVSAVADRVFDILSKHHDARSGGFYQAPKFPQESYLRFLLAYYRVTGKAQALDMVTLSLQKMAAGGIYDHVGCGFHRYAVDKEWYVPHFEKMLYTQAQLAGVYTDAAQLTGNPYFAEIAKGILDFVSGPMTDAGGGFYAAIDAETDGVEGAYYAWRQEDIAAALTPEEQTVFAEMYALAEIPVFPGHKHADGQALIARKPLDAVAREGGMPYLQVAAIAAQLMNKLLLERNKRQPPRLDDKMIVGWNGLMIAAFAHAGQVFAQARYIECARKAAHFLLEHAIDNDGKLHRIYAGGRAQHEATLEDYAGLIHGLIALEKASPDPVWKSAATALAARVEECFSDPDAPGYFLTAPADDVLVRIKSCDDSALPSANAVMLANHYALAELTGDTGYREKADRVAAFFLSGNLRVAADYAGMVAAAMVVLPDGSHAPTKTVMPQPQQEARASVAAALFPPNAAPGDDCEVIVSVDIAEGWHVYAAAPDTAETIVLQVAVQGQGVELLGMVFPEPLRRDAGPVYEGMVHVTARLRLSKGAERPPLRVMVRYQPCSEQACEAVRDISLTI